MPIFNNPSSYSLFKDPLEQFLNPSPIPSFGVPNPTSLLPENNGYQSHLNSLFESNTRRQEAEELDKKRARKQGILQALPAIAQILTAKDNRQISQALELYTQTVEAEKDRKLRQQTQDKQIQASKESQERGFAQSDKSQEREFDFRSKSQRAGQDFQLRLADDETIREEARSQRDFEQKKEYARYAAGLEKAKIEFSDMLQTRRAEGLMAMDIQQKEFEMARSMALDMQGLTFPSGVTNADLRSAASKLISNDEQSLTPKEKTVLAIYGNYKQSTTQQEWLRGATGILLELSNVKASKGPGYPAQPVGDALIGGQLIFGPGFTTDSILSGGPFGGNPFAIPEQEGPDLEGLLPAHGDVAMVLRDISNTYTSGDTKLASNRLAGIAKTMLELRDNNIEQARQDVELLGQDLPINLAVQLFSYLDDTLKEKERQELNPLNPTHNPLYADPLRGMFTRNINGNQ